MKNDSVLFQGLHEELTTYKLKAKVPSPPPPAREHPALQNKNIS